MATTVSQIRRYVQKIASDDAIEVIDCEPLSSVCLLECLLPEFGGKLEGAVVRPVPEEDEEVAEIGPRIDVLETAGGNEGGKDKVQQKLYE